MSKKWNERGNMLDTEVKQKLDKMIREYSEVCTDDMLLEGKSLIEDLRYDSISLMQLISDIEDEFGISMDDDVFIDSFDNYNSLFEYILERI